MPMTPPTDPAAFEARGRLLRLDTLNRELTLLVGEAAVELDVPPSCPVVLNGQAVRLRLLQPQDRLRVTYHPALGRGVARHIEVITF
jgi:hypothetical protein